MISTPLDNAKLDSKEHYVFYHNIVAFALNELLESVRKHNLCNVYEYPFFKQYCNLLLYSINAMRIKYMYDDEDHMKVDLTDSGFPNSLEFRYLYNDLELRDNYTKKLSNVTVFKEKFIDQLLREKKPISKDQLFQASSLVYYTTTERKHIFNRFVQGKIIEISKNTTSKHMVSWSFYDVGYNRPFVCFMYFDFKGRSIKSYKNDIYDVLKHTADRLMALDTMAYSIDKKLPEIFPKKLIRIDLGPLHNIFAKDENEITHAILEGISQKNIALESFALSLKVDELHSESTFKEGGFFSKKTLQKWNSVNSKQYVLAPHRIIQLLYNKVPEIINKLTKEPIEINNLPKGALNLKAI